MSYGFDDKTKDTESGSKFLKAGIQEGVFLKEVNVIQQKIMLLLT